MKPRCHDPTYLLPKATLQIFPSFVLCLPKINKTKIFNKFISSIIRWKKIETVGHTRYDTTGCTVFDMYWTDNDVNMTEIAIWCLAPKGGTWTTRSSSTKDVNTLVIENSPELGLFLTSIWASSGTWAILRFGSSMLLAFYNVYAVDMIWCLWKFVHIYGMMDALNLFELLFWKRILSIEKWNKPRKLRENWRFNIYEKFCFFLCDFVGVSRFVGGYKRGCMFFY